MKFFIEQIALHPTNPEAARALLTDLGLTEWVQDTVLADGQVFSFPGSNTADLAFNYQATRPDPKPLELEILHYKAGPNWMHNRGAAVSHLGMHCTAEELEEFERKFAAMGIKIAQSVFTRSHTNPFLLANGRKYQYVIFDTKEILGVDLKFIVRREEEPRNG